LGGLSLDQGGSQSSRHISASDARSPWHSSRSQWAPIGAGFERTLLHKLYGLNPINGLLLTFIAHPEPIVTSLQRE